MIEELITVAEKLDKAQQELELAVKAKDKIALIGSPSDAIAGYIARHLLKMVSPITLKKLDKMGLGPGQGLGYD